jgi:S-adenosylmethionine synthetase
MKRLITSESVTEGHPDKVCDQISDAILDACLYQDRNSRVGLETAVKTVNGGQHVVLLGEVTTNAKIDYEGIVRDTLRDIGYTDSAFGMNADKVQVYQFINSQSQDIAQGVNEFNGHEEGAGDQGMMWGYANRDTERLMPLPISLSHDLTRKLAEVRKNGKIPHLGPDGKSVVTVEYERGVPKRLDTVVIAQQHTENINEEELYARIKGEVIIPVCEEYGLDDNTNIYVNSTGKFVIGGPEGDAGVTGRKIIVDTYGGFPHSNHGGGAFSGKDPTKVDRSAAYAARHIAKNLVEAGFVDECAVQLAYTIGVAEPVSVNVEGFGTEDRAFTKGDLSRAIYSSFPLKPAEILDELNLKNPIYRETASGGHFGREPFEENGLNYFTWEGLRSF